MSLKKCDECGKEISTVAKTCPHCGAPSKSKKIETQITGGCALVVLAVILFSCLNGSGHQTVNPTVEDKERAAKFGISIDVYMAAKAAEPDAYAACDT